ncbi:hypothetical protein [Rhodopseudomonas sp. B29]|uniref:hypothetical protein n=1 Tax=Rhodopseudomonas sp. B29 TaxID=95607 RepID=UPI00034D70AC|nr:hypothetical protein [Rhodopseudomonas sp. B29]
MITVPALAADALGNFIADYMHERYGSTEPHLCDVVPSIARIALECIGNSDALYPHVEHTMLVTLAGHHIMRGRALHSDMSAADYAHIIIGCLTHDIGYVRGLFEADGDDGYVADASGRKVTLPRGASDASMLPFHVDRSKRYVLERLGSVEGLDAKRIACAIEGTRFPPQVPAEGECCPVDSALLRAADFIGQLGDPNYIRKANALYYEFEESGLNRQLGYSSPADIVNLYPQFYWDIVSPHIQTAIRYLNVTADGRQWIANLYSNVFRAERDIRLSGPQK